MLKPTQVSVSKRTKEGKKKKKKKAPSGGSNSSIFLSFPHLYLFNSSL